MSDLRADLHIHTNFSDSTMSPAEVVSEALKAGLAAISITDHDTIDGILPARDAAQGSGLEVIAGVELSSEEQKKDIHILGYMFDMDNSPLTRMMAEMQQVRMDRMRKMIAKLQEMGIGGITFEEVCGLLKSDAVGRLHLANLLVAKKLVPDLEEVFRRYLGEGCPAYFPKFMQTPLEAIKLIKDSGGLAIMAHPMLTGRDELIPSFVRAGLDGLECFYPNCQPEVTAYYMRLAAKHGILVTGGSDAHGFGKTSTYIGKAYVIYEYVQMMKKRRILVT